MDAIVAQTLARMNRRQLFGAAATGVGTRPASLLGDDLRAEEKRPGRWVNGAARPAAPCAESRSGHLPLAGGRAVPSRPVDPNRCWRICSPGPAESVRGTTRLSTMTAGTEMARTASIKPFKKWGKSGLEISTLLPHTGSIADELCLVRSVNTEAVNHAPGVTFFLTGAQVRTTSMGAWLTYGLGSEAADLPAFVVMTSSDKGDPAGIVLRLLLGQRFPAEQVPGTRFRAGVIPSLSEQSARRQRGRSAQAARWSRAAQPAAPRRTGRSGDGDANRPV